MATKWHKRMTVLTRTRNGVLGLGRVLVGICIIGTALWVSSPQSALGLNQEPQEEEEEEQGCGYGSGPECASVGFCIDLWKIVTLCRKVYYYYPAT